MPKELRPGVVGITALLALRRAGLAPGEKVAVLGATGGVGQMAVQLWSLLGAGGVVAVGRDRETLDAHVGSRPDRLPDRDRPR